MWCVHAFELREFENVEAADAASAEEQVMAKHYRNDYGDVARVEVMRQCECGSDNDPAAKTCDDCGEPL